MIKSFFYITVLLMMIGGMCSCGSTKNLQYMQGNFDTAKLSAYNVPALLIQKGDLLSIIVYSDNATATAIYNQSGAGTGNNSSAVPGSPVSSSGSGGYLVDEDGNIQFQGIGMLHVEGLTKAGLTGLLNSKLTTFLQNPYYTIRFLNYKITVIGDVAKPAVYSIPAERVNILEAIGFAGDLNITARRDNIRIIREEAGKREFGVVDLRQPDIFNNKFYQLHQNDIVYVDFNKSKAVNSDQTTLRNIGIVTSIVSIIAIVISVLRR
ncbi:MAG: polysaccharide biosynthesis/export family protein [Bacteroidota bacterium]